MTGKFRFLIAFLAIACAALSAKTASAVATSWTVVSSASTITFNADIGPGFTATAPQGVGLFGPSDTTAYTGTINGDVTGPILSPTGLSLTSASLDAAVSGVWSPDVGGAAGSSDADYGFFLVGAVAGEAAVRNLFFDVSKAATPVVAGTWDADGTGFTITSGDLDYTTGLTGPGTTPLAGTASFNDPTVGTLVTVGLVETLTIPVSILDSTSLDLSGIPVFITITGTIVATRIVPEPGTFVMLGLGAALLVPAAVRRYRKRG